MKYNISNDQLAEIGEVIFEQAIEIFKYCDSPDDFCIQSINSGESIVFGGWNRLIFRPELGWYISMSHCTSKFAAKFFDWRKANCHYELNHN